ncbi:MAG TPA: DUF4214 domain-containing protein, partial [Pirellulales bacterium]|nr:DUF4214 domain-containing protein [Pirellulales bacterium]
MFSSRRSRRAKAAQRASRRHGFRPRLQSLEPRLLLTVTATSPSATLAFTEGLSNAVTLGTFSSPDTALQTISAEIDWGDGTSSAGAIVVTETDKFSVTGQHTYADETAAGASLPVTVVVTDGSDNTSATLVDAATVADADAPLSASPLVIDATEMTAFANAPVAQIFSSNASNVAGDFTATINWGDGSQSPGELTGGSDGVFTLVGSHSYAEDGKYTLGSVVTDPDGPSITVSSTANVAETTLSATAVAVTGVEQTTFTAAVATFTHGDGSEPVGEFAATIDWGDGANGVGTVSENSGVYTISGSHAYAEDGSYFITVAVNDTSGGESAGALATASIAEAPFPAQGVPVTGVEQSTFTAAVATFTHGDGSEPPREFAATIDWGDGTSNAGTVSETSGVYTISGSHAYAEDGSYAITAVVSDASGGKNNSGTATATARIAEAPFFSDGVPLSGVEQSTLTAVVATFTHGDGSEPASEFTATIDWGDGATSTGNISSSGVYAISGSHAYAENGAYTLTIVVSDDSNGSATITTTASISDATLSVTGNTVAGTEGETLTAAVATFTHGDGSEPASSFQATIDWDDGPTQAGTITESQGVYTVTGSHAYAEDDAYPLRIVILDLGGTSATASGVATIDEPPLSATGVAINGQPFAPFSGPVATFSHGNGGEAADGFAATINWGDGTITPGEIKPASGHYEVDGSHTYSATGVFAMTVLIDDLDSGSASASSTATITASAVAATAVAVVAQEADDFTGPVATFTLDGSEAPASNFTASIAWGDGNTSPGTVTGGNGQYTVSGSHIYAEDGSYPVAVVINPSQGNASTVDTTATIAEAPIVGVGLPVGGMEMINSTTPVVTFTAGAEPVSDFTAVIDWGEGVVTPGIIRALPNGQYQVSGTYAYLDEGSYPIAVTITETGEPAASAVIRTTANIDEGPPSVDGPGIAGTPAQDYISQLYRDVLNRPVDRPSSQVLVNLLLAGQPRLVIAEPLAHSPERLRQVVTQAYHDYLGRAPDADGLNYWVAAIGLGVTDEQLAASMIASDEFFQAAGGDNQAWVDALYLKLLGREADAGGEAYWLSQLAHGGNRFQLA